MPSSKPGSPTTNGSGLNRAQLARARSHGYRLFSQLYLQGITSITLPYLQKIPELTAVLPKAFDPDAAAAGHHALFQQNIIAYESFFLGDNGLVGGEKTAAVQHNYQQSGYVPTGAEVDFLGEELGFLAYLTGAEADAWESSQPENAEKIQKIKYDFLVYHLLRWLPACALAIQNQPDSFFSQVAKLTLAAVLEHFATLATVPLEEAAIFFTPHFLPPSQNILADDKTGLKEIARFLLLPGLSGIYLSRDNISHLARQFELPRGFGTREQMLLNLLRTAVQYDAFTQLLAALEETCQEWKSSYRQLADDYPKSAPFIHPWLVRAALTEILLATMKTSSPNLG